jgi:hypothetical protein
MNRLGGQHVPVRFFDQHSYICDLIYFDGPLLSLYRAARQDWLYLWAENDGPDRERWLVFPVDRTSLVGYLRRDVSLRELFLSHNQVHVLGLRRAREVGQGAATTHRTGRRVALAEVIQYAPTEDSLFEEDLTPDISIARQIAPERFNVPIAGEWFLPDIGTFSRRYSRIYSFLYCTRPQFVSNLSTRVSRYLRQPWTGGYSRVNFFDALHQQIPSIHDMRVTGYDYHSPGDIEIEALSAVGRDVAAVALRYLADQQAIDDARDGIDDILGEARLRTEDLSQVSDRAIAATREQLQAIQNRIDDISNRLGLQREFELLGEMSPNTVVKGKVVLTLTKQLAELAGYQSLGLLDLARPPETEEDDDPAA